MFEAATIPRTSSVIVDGTAALYGDIQQEVEDDDTISSRSTIRDMLARIFKKAVMSFLLLDNVTDVVMAFDRPEAADGRKRATQHARDADFKLEEAGYRNASLLSGLHADGTTRINLINLNKTFDTPLPKGGVSGLLANRARKNELRALFGLYVCFVAQSVGRYLRGRWSC